MHRRLLACATLLFASAVPAFAGSGDSCCDPSTACGKKDEGNQFVICHPKETYQNAKGGWEELAGGATIRVPPGKTSVKVIQTNTAVFDYQLSSEAVDVPEAKQLNAFLEAFGPYVVDVLGAAAPARRFLGEALVSPADDLKAALSALDVKIDEIRGIRDDVLSAYSVGEVTDLKTSIGEICMPREVCQAKFDGLAEGLLDAYDDVEAALQKAIASKVPIELSFRATEGDLENDLEALESLDEPNEDQVAAARDRRVDLFEQRQLKESTETDLNTLIASARKALDESQKVLELVRTLERNVLDGLDAMSTWTSPSFPISLQKGRKVTLKITPKPIASVAAAGRLPKVDIAFTLLPAWRIRPVVGLSLLYTADAVFPEYGTTKTKVSADDPMDPKAMVDRYEIVEKDMEDDRFTYGLNLGLTVRGLCSAQGQNCPWLDLIVNPTDDVSALGTGLSYNFRILKLGAGVLWTRHKALDDGQALGDLLMTEDALKTRDTYGGPQFFISLSVIGWQPFVND